MSSNTGFSITWFTPISSDTKYVSLLDILNKKVNEPFFEKCGSVDKQIIRKCIIKNTIPDNAFIFVGNNKVSNSKNSRATPYVSESYANEWIYDTEKIIQYRNEQQKILKKDRAKKISQTRVERKGYDPTQLKPLPDIVDLDENEGFKDEDGNVLHIEMRGERTQKGLYFKASDLGQLHDRVYNIVIQKTSDFEYDKHYVFFDESNIGTRNSGTDVNSSQRVPDTDVYNGYINYVSNVNYSADVTPKRGLYLTYFGIVKLLICSRSSKAEPFQEWVLTTLFTHQFGEQEQKDDLAANLLGITPKTICDVFRKSTNTIPCVYLFKIGKVGDVRDYLINKMESINLEGYCDNDILYKFGRTNDLARRTKEHASTYGKMSKEFTLETFNYIDKALACKAERSINHFFNASDMRINDIKHTEVVVIKPEKMKYTIEWFQNVQMMYSGNSYELIKQLDDLKHENVLIKKEHENQLLVKQHENQLLLQDNEKLIFKHRSELQAMEIDMLKTKLLN